MSSPKMIENKDLPSWAKAAIDQRIAHFTPEIELAKQTNTGVVFMPLTEPPDGASKYEYETWDRSCDNCNEYVPIGTELMMASTSVPHDGVQVLVMFGSCVPCSELP